MMAGQGPFRAADPATTYERIQRGKFSFPNYFSFAVRDLIRGLLQIRPIDRFGIVHGGVNKIKNHAWFDGFDWSSFNTRKMQAPHQKAVKNQYDLTHFDEYPPEEHEYDEYIPP